MAPPRQHHHHNHNNNGSSHRDVNTGSSFLNIGGVSNSATTPTTHDGSRDTAALSDSSSGLPPAPHKVDASQAQACRLQDAYWSDEEEDMDCPLCLEEIDISDANFKPCPCGYQICRFCWHHIKQNLNGRCPACRRKYTDTSVEFKAMSQDEIKRLAQAKKQKEREKKELEQMNRKHLANMRVVQKNLVYVVGIDPKLAKEELIPTLRSNEFFGQYGRISKILISKRTTASKLVMGTQESAIGVYVTYVRKEDAAKAIVAIDGSKGPDGKTIRASYGTTKYCTNYLRNLPCANTICTYLHEPGEEADSFTKEDLSTLRHAAKDTEHKSSRSVPPPASFTLAGSKTSHLQQEAALPATSPTTTTIAAESIEASALPKTASWASGRPGMISSASNSGNNTIPQNSTALRDQDLPPLSAIPQQQIRKSTARTNSSSAASKNTSAASNRGQSTSNVVSSAANDASSAHRSDSPVPATLSNTASPVSPSIALPPVPPGISKLNPKIPSTVQRLPQEDKEEVEMASSPKFAAPPGLTKLSSHLGQSSRPATPSEGQEGISAIGNTPPASINAHSTYQPSSGAQALLDDMKLRRAAEADFPTKSPFPDFDAVLSNFKNGDDFCFTLEESQIPVSIKDRSDVPSAFGAFAPTFLGSQQSFLLGRNNTATPPPPPPPGIATPNQSRDHSPSPFPGGFFSNGFNGNSNAMGGAYNGPFDPFAPDASEIGRGGDLNGITRSLEDQRLGNTDNGQTHEAYEDDEARSSRFGFSKRRESPFFKTHDDLLGFVKGGARLNADINEDPRRHQEGQRVQHNNDSLNWLNDMQRHGSNSIPNSNGAFSFENGNNAFIGPRGNGSTFDGNRQDPLLAQLNNTHRSMESLPYNDPAIMSFTRQQQQQQSQSQEEYGGAFNPFEANTQSAQSYRPVGGYQQPYSNHRTFA